MGGVTLCKIWTLSSLHFGIEYHVERDIHRESMDKGWANRPVDLRDSFGGWGDSFLQKMPRRACIWREVIEGSSHLGNRSGNINTCHGPPMISRAWHPCADSEEGMSLLRHPKAMVELIPKSYEDGPPSCWPPSTSETQFCLRYGNHSTAAA